MEVQLQELYFSEVDSGRLMYEDDPEYERRRQALSSSVTQRPGTFSGTPSYVSLTRAIWSPSPTASVWDFGWP